MPEQKNCERLWSSIMRPALACLPCVSTRALGQDVTNQPAQRFQLALTSTRRLGPRITSLSDGQHARGQ